MHKIIVIRNGKIVRIHGPYCWYFCLNLKYLVWTCRVCIIKAAKNGDFCKELLSESDFEVVLAIFCCCDHIVKASEDRYRSKWVSQILLGCYNLLNSQKIPICQEQWKMVGYTRIPPTWLKSWSCTEKRAIRGPWWVLSIMEVRTCINNLDGT